jgi:hypothetical protein
LVQAANDYQQSMERRIANYFAKAQPGLDCDAEREFVKMITDMATLFAKWDEIVEEDIRRTLRGERSVLDWNEIAAIRVSSMETVRKLERFEVSNTIAPGTISRQLTIAGSLWERTAKHFENEAKLLQRVKKFCLNGGVPSEGEEILADLRKLQFEKSTAYTTDYDFARSLFPHPLLPNGIGMLDAWAFAHECVHDIREWKHDLNNSIFNYFLILVSIVLPKQEDRRSFFEGYMLTSESEAKAQCEATFRIQGQIITNEFKQLNTEIDVIRTFLDDLLEGAFDDTFANIEKHLSR